MASDYGLNFGFRRSAETMARQVGRYKTPAGAAGALQIGTAVKIDAAEAGYLVACEDGDPLIPGFSGLLVQEDEHIDFGSGYTPSSIDSFDLGVTAPNRLSAFWFGAGVTVWMKNSPEITRVDGRVIPAVTMFDPTSVEVGGYLGWNGTAWENATAPATPAETDPAAVDPRWMVVTAFDDTADNEYVEAVLLK